MFGAVGRAVNLPLALAFLERHQRVIAREPHALVTIRARLTQELRALSAAHSHAILIRAIATIDRLLQINREQVQHVLRHEIRLQATDPSVRVQLHPRAACGARQRLLALFLVSFLQTFLAKRVQTRQQLRVFVMLVAQVAGQVSAHHTATRVVESRHTA